MNLEELLIRQLKLQNDIQDETNKLLREILKALIKKQKVYKMPTKYAVYLVLLGGVFMSFVGLYMRLLS